MKTGRAQVVEPARYKEMTSVLFHALSARVRVHACAGKQKRENISLKKKKRCSSILPIRSARNGRQDMTTKKKWTRIITGGRATKGSEFRMAMRMQSVTWTLFYVLVDHELRNPLFVFEGRLLNRLIVLLFRVRCSLCTGPGLFWFRWRLHF